MRLKRYVAMSMRAALARIRAEEGEDAILLAHRPLGEGVEVIAATAAEDLWDLVPHVDEASAPPGGATASASTSAPTSASTSAPTSTAGAVPTQAGRPLDLARFLAEQAESREAESREAEPVPPRPALTPLSDPALARLQQDLSSFRGIVEQQLAGLALADPALRPAGRAESLARLLALGFAPPLARELALALPAEGAAAAAWSLCQAELVRRLPVAPEVLLAEGGVAAFLGPTGAGKTTVLAMIAARHALIYGSDSVALLTTDDRRIGAQEELKVLSRLLGIPLWLATEAHGLEKVLQGLLGRRLVLVDTPGRCSPGALATLAALPPTAAPWIAPWITPWPGEPPPPSLAASSPRPTRRWSWGQF